MTEDERDEWEDERETERWYARLAAQNAPRWEALLAERRQRAEEQEKEARR